MIVVWWNSTNSTFVLSFPICPIMQEKLPPSLVAPIAVSNSFLNEVHKKHILNSADC